MLGRWQSFPAGPHRRRRSAWPARSSRSPRRWPVSRPSSSRLRRRRRSTSPAAVGRLGEGLAEPLAGDASDRLDAGRQLRRDEHAELGIELDACSSLREQRVGGPLPAEATSRSQSMLSSSTTRRRTRPLRPCAASSRGRTSRRSRTSARRFRPRAGRPRSRAPRRRTRERPPGCPA